MLLYCSLGNHDRQIPCGVDASWIFSERITSRDFGQPKGAQGIQEFTRRAGITNSTLDCPKHPSASILAESLGMLRLDTLDRPLAVYEWCRLLLWSVHGGLRMW